jgi:hypothetical protein
VASAIAKVVHLWPPPGQRTMARPSLISLASIAAAQSANVVHRGQAKAVNKKEGEILYEERNRREPLSYSEG